MTHKNTSFAGFSESSNLLPEILKDDSLHNDCINGVSFHPFNSEIIATCSGQRHQNLNLSSWDGSADEDSENEDKCRKDISLKVWNLGIK